MNEFNSVKTAVGSNTPNWNDAAKNITDKSKTGDLPNHYQKVGSHLTKAFQNNSGPSPQTLPNYQETSASLVQLIGSLQQISDQQGSSEAQRTAQFFSSVITDCARQM